MKKIYSLFLIAAILAACVGCKEKTHKHSFGEWETKAPAACESAEIEARKCECGEEETREGDPATGHTFTSITAVSKLEKPMAGLTVEASDLSVTAACLCGESVPVTDGITVENATLALGKNTVTVKFGDISTTLDIEAAKLDVVLDGVVTDDTHISSESKDKENSAKKEMGTKVDMFRVYLRVNVGEIIHTNLFTSNKENAKVQLVLPVTGGSAADNSTFKLRVYAPAVGVTDVDFSKLTWNSVDKDSTYGALNWSNGAVLVDTGVGHNASVGNNQITVTVAYSQIADFVDENGNIVFAFATNTDGLKIGSLENKTEENRPAVKVLLNDEHFHIFDQKEAQSKYFVSAKCKERAKYYTSCICGEAGWETFAYGEIIDHTYGKAIPEKPNTCTTDGVKEHYRCSSCGKYFLYRNGQMKLVTAEDVKLSAGHNYKEIPQKDPTCTEDGNYKYYKCGMCGEYFDAQKNPTTKEAQKIPKLGHTYGNLIPEQPRSCTEDGVKAHYECEACGKNFLEKDGEKVLVTAEDLRISAGHDMKVIGAREPTCTKDGNYKYYQCRVCSKYFVDKEGTTETTKDAQRIEALGHAYTSISAVSNLVNPMATMVVEVSDLSVTGICGRCGESVAITEGIEIEGATLVLGENTVTVTYGELSTTLTIEAAELNIVLDGVIRDDTYVSSSSKDSEYSAREEMGTYSSSFRSYFRVNVSSILENELFLQNEEHAKVQFIFTITAGSVSDNTSYTLKTFAPASGITDAPFSALTWNSVNNKEGAVGEYSLLNWGNGTELATNASVDNGRIIITLDYSQIANYVDENGDVLFAFATNTSGLKIASMENTAEAAPVFQVVLDED